MDYLPIEKDLIPYRFDIAINNETFTFEFHYNSEGDFFTCDLLKGETVLLYGEKISYGVYMFGAQLQDGKIITRDVYSKAILLPLDVSGQSTRVGWDELGESVLVYVLTEGELNV